MSLASIAAPAVSTDRRSAAPVPVSELLSVTYGTDRSGAVTVVYTGRAMAAVKLAMGSDSYSDAERQDAAAELLARVLSDTAAARRRCRCSGPVRWQHLVTDDFGSLVPVPTCDRHKSPGARPVIAREDIIPADLAAVTRLYNVACHLRRTIDRDRARDLAHGAAQAEAADLQAHTEVTPSWDAQTPHGARRAALDMLANAGVIGDTGRRIPAPLPAPMRQPHGRPADVIRYIDNALDGKLTLRHTARLPWRRRSARVQVGNIPAPLWTLAYTVARTATGGLESREVAEELDLSYPAYRQHLSRAVKALDVPGADAPRWADALGILPGGIEHPHTANLPESFGVRTAPGHTFPNVDGARRIIAADTPREHRATRTVKRWDTVPVGRRSRADWAKGIPARSASRLAAAATVQRRRTAATPVALRDSRRLEAGLSPVVQ